MDLTLQQRAMQANHAAVLARRQKKRNGKIRS